MRMNDTLPAVLNCWGCGAALDSGDNYCRNCGRGQGKNIPWYYGHFGIVVLTVAVMGPLSLIFVWRSPLLSRAAKAVYTAAITIFTWYVVVTLQKLWQAANSLLSGALPF